MVTSSSIWEAVGTSPQAIIGVAERDIPKFGWPWEMIARIVSSSRVARYSAVEMGR